MSTNASTPLSNRHSTPLSNRNKTLVLSVKHKWFKMIYEGDKLEEYRKLTPYWNSRLTEYKFINLLDAKKRVTRQFDVVEFRNGYGFNVPTLQVRCNGVSIRTGRTEWGATEGELYFVIELGNTLFYKSKQ